eukprot:TRINITY_DN244_c0_g1_i1.p1 TRINITY_DN244_c0_g1~~TRINITY_DN244_c0_g1_i1.p1  ORF type:complete len:370 (+),score=78.19 TRINITY_DN244_c0_g1_i1:218-1327(+)
MQKQTKPNISETNISNLGSDLEKKCRTDAGDKEEQWKDAGKDVGVQVWRIEQFKVKPVPKEDHGKFYSGDSYIVLNTYKKDPAAPALSWNLHFWLGQDTTQDEAGTAAYKTVELDDHLGGGPIQYREVQGKESDLFLKCFDGKITIPEGGVASGFHHVKAEEFKTRLLHIKGKLGVNRVPVTFESMNTGDVFILDAGLKIYNWHGKKAQIFEKDKGIKLSNAIRNQRKGAEVIPVEEGSEREDFWIALGGKGPISQVTTNDSEADREAKAIRKLFKLSDAKGKLEFTEVTQTKIPGKITKGDFDQKDAFIFDMGSDVFVWIGGGASEGEKKYAPVYAQRYLIDFQRPHSLQTILVREKETNEFFERSLD